jgi:hypothetical protein
MRTRIRLLVPVALAALVTASSPPAARAGVPAALVCSETKTVDCVRDEILIIDGSKTFQDRPLVSGCEDDVVDGRVFKICSTLSYGDVAEYAQSLLRANGQVQRWETWAIFGADVPRPQLDVITGPLFKRFRGSNEISGTGLVRAGIDQDRPFVGVIEAGSTVDFGVFREPPRSPPEGLARWPDPDPAGVEGFEDFYNCGTSSSCYPAFFNGYQALAQATGHMYIGSEIKLGTLPDNLEQHIGTAPLNGQLNEPVTGKPAEALSNVSVFVRPGGKNAAFANNPIWDSRFNMGGSMFGGNHWRTNANGFVETTLPSAFWVAAPPYTGREMVRFHPWELYFMGLAPIVGLPKIIHYAWTPPDGENQNQINIIPENLTGLSPVSFGMRPGFRMQPLKSLATVPVDEYKRVIDPIQLATGPGLRFPDFEDAPHTHRQLWIVVTKPNDPEKTAQQIAFMVKWRRAWNAYFYLLTGYTGRMVTTFDAATDDSPTWEFGQPIDDEKTFAAVGGLQVIHAGRVPEAGTNVINTFSRVTMTPGAAGGLRFTAHGKNQLPLVIKGDQSQPGAYNVLAIRMRVPPGTPATRAVLQLEGGPAVTLPAVEGSFLIPDGRWHTYSTDLTTVPGFVGGTFTGFTFAPSIEPANDIDIESIRFINAKDEKLGDSDVGCDGLPRPDGFVDAEDNCALYYNPGQEDANNDGVGDACDDLDNDGAANACDNCPVVTNSRQRDRDGDGLGDACDPDPGAGCFLQPESVAGRSRRAPVGLALVLGFGLAVVAWRGRRKR